VKTIRKILPQILALSWLIVFSTGMYFPNFANFLGIAKGPKPFMDLQAVLSAGDCKGESTAKLLAGVCDPWNRPIPYPSWILELVQFLHLSNSYYLIIGWINAALIAFSIYFLGKRCREHMFWFSLAVMAPPMFFLAERGNIDSIILFLVLIFITRESGNRSPWHLWIPGILTAAKIYPVGLFFSLNKKRDLLISIVIGLLFLPIWIGNLHSILGNQPHSRGWSYGNIILLTQDMDKMYLIGAIDFRITLFVALITLLIWLAGFGLAMLVFKNKIEQFNKTLEENPFSKTMYLSGSFVFLVTYIGISVGDYKLWTALIVVASLLTLPDMLDNKIRNTLLMLIVFGMWGSRYTPTFIEALGDIALYCSAAILYAINLHYLISKVKKINFAKSL